MVKQVPLPDTTQVFHCGETIAFELQLAREEPGTAWVRTDLGNAARVRQRIINLVEHPHERLVDAWQDLPMMRTSPGRFSLTLPLTVPGHFMAKCYFLPHRGETLVWPQGGNTVINVEPAPASSGLTLYNAFVRQFGATRHRRKALPIPHGDHIEALEAAGYTVIPPSGTFRDLAAQVPFIMETLGCRFLHLLPIHPTPTTYGRMGRFGSPYAALDFFSVDPALAFFDPAATPMEQFLELVNAVHRCHGHLILDIAINHTGWAASLHQRRPKWLKRDGTGRMELPGAWGVTWEDLTRLDYGQKELWTYMAKMFLFWCRKGVDGFRCDAGYMIPEKTWQYIIARVRQQYPDTIFFLEGLGGKISTSCNLLNRAGMNWAYSELFQNYAAPEIRSCMEKAMDMSKRFGTLIHFAETHDNNRLAAVSHVHAVMRTALCALLSLRGGFGFANGVEWFATEKIDVHQCTGLNWGAGQNQVDHISTLCGLLTALPVFGEQGEAEFLDTLDDQVLVLKRRHRKTGAQLLVLVNLDCRTARQAGWLGKDFGGTPGGLTELLSQATVLPDGHHDRLFLDLAPGQVMALSRDPEDLERVLARKRGAGSLPGAVLHLCLARKVLALHCAFHGMGDVSHLDIQTVSQQLAENPRLCAGRIAGSEGETPVVDWVWERDETRTVMVPPGFCLHVTAPAPFRAEIRWAGGREEEDSPVVAWETALPLKKGGYFALFMPLASPAVSRRAFLVITLAHARGPRRCRAALLYLSDPVAVSSSGGHTGSPPFFAATYSRKWIASHPDLKLLGTTRRGAMMRAPAGWGRLESRYDALLAANLSPDLPENRWIMLSRFRIWVICQGHSRELTLDCLDDFSFSYANAGRWRFTVSTLQGGELRMVLDLVLHDLENALSLTVHRHLDSPNGGRKISPKGIQVVIRPDVEDRSFHDTIKAWSGPEQAWPAAVAPAAKGFVFRPAPERRLCLSCDCGAFVHQPEWQYMVHRPLEARRGLDADSDLFSPGYFRLSLEPGQRAVIRAQVAGADGPAADWEKNGDVCIFYVVSRTIRPGAGGCPEPFGLCGGSQRP